MIVPHLPRLLIFYRHNCIVPVIISLACCVLYYANGKDAVTQVTTKLLTEVVIILIISVIQKDKLYYYYNLHLSRRILFAGFFIIDLLIFILCLWLTATIF